MKRVLIIINDVTVGGGAEKIATQVGTGLHRLGHDVSFFTFCDSSSRYPLSGNYVSLAEEVPQNLFSKLIRQFTRAKKIASFCKKQQIDTAVSFLDTANVPTILSKILFGNKARIILSVRNNPLKKSIVVRNLIRILFPLANAVISLSRGVEASLTRHFSLSNVKTIYNLQDIDHFKKRSKEKLVTRKEKNSKEYQFITVGRLHPQKAQWNLLRSFKEVNRQNPNTTLLIVGKGELEENLKQLTNRLGIEDNVTFLGVVENVFTYLRNADCFVFTSQSEGFGNVLTEALALNIPIISTDCESGPREILCPELSLDQKISYPYYGSYGVLVQTIEHNTYEGLHKIPLDANEKMLSDVMLTFSKNKKLNFRYAKGLTRAKDFDKTTIIKEWEDII